MFTDVRDLFMKLKIYHDIYFLIFRYNRNSCAWYDLNMTYYL